MLIVVCSLVQRAAKSVARDGDGTALSESQKAVGAATDLILTSAGAQHCAAASLGLRSAEEEKACSPAATGTTRGVCAALCAADMR